MHKYICNTNPFVGMAVGIWDSNIGFMHLSSPGPEGDVKGPGPEVIKFFLHAQLN